MSKLYKFDIYYRDTRYNQNGQGAVSARTARDARNLFLAGKPYMKITACVRRDEVRSSGNIQKNYAAGRANKSDDSGSSLGSILLGAAVTAGVGLAAKWFSDKSKDKA